MPLSLADSGHAAPDRSPSSGIPNFPIRPLLTACAFATLWHILLLAFGSRDFEPQKTVDKPRKPQEVAARIVQEETSTSIQAWYHWDALWFVHLSRSGYVLETDHDGRIEQSNIAFTPGLAVVAAASDRFLPDPWRFLLVFNAFAAFLASLALGAISWRLNRSKAAMVWAIVAFNVWPWRFFLVAPYQEAAGSALAFWAIYAAISGYVLPGFVFSLVSSAFRLNAIGLFGGFLAGSLVEFLRNRERSMQLRNMIVGSGALIGWGLLLAYFQYRFGDAGLGVKIQSTWGRQPPHLTGIVESLAGPLMHPMTGTEWLDWAAAWTVLAAIPVVYRNYGTAWATSLAGLTFQAMSTGRVLSFGRFALLACPFFIVAGTLATKRPTLAKAVCSLSLVAQIGLAWRYGHDLFAG
ncbi:hypothetical protein GC170_00750 [bacterium]|nr:hypothetical protein [bacterium]